MVSVQVILKSGKSFCISCEDFIVKTEAGVMTGYEFKKASENIPLFINIPDVSAIIYSRI